MSWIVLATLGQFVLAVVALIDKYIVSDKTMLPRPFVYAFYTCLISGVWIVLFVVGLIPHDGIGFSIPSLADVEKPTLEIVALSILGAYTFFIGLVSMFSALKEGDASDVIPVIGAVSALGSFGLGYLFLNSDLSPNYILGIAFLATGTFLVSHVRFSAKVAMLAVHSGLFFALHWISVKGLFDVTGFSNGFFWSRIGLVFIAVSLLLVPTYYEKIREQTRITSRKAGVLVFTNKVLAGISTILIFKATELGKVEVVQALGGLQFVFLLLFGMMFSRYLPDTAGEADSRKESVVQKALFVAVIVFGYILLFR